MRWLLCIVMLVVAACGASDDSLPWGLESIPNACTDDFTRQFAFDIYEDDRDVITLVCGQCRPNDSLAQGWRYTKDMCRNTVSAEFWGRWDQGETPVRVHMVHGSDFLRFESAEINPSVNEIALDSSVPNECEDGGAGVSWECPGGDNKVLVLSRFRLPQSAFE